jgi:hypothetical protein
MGYKGIFNKMFDNSALVELSTHAVLHDRYDLVTSSNIYFRNMSVKFAKGVSGNKTLKVWILKGVSVADAEKYIHTQRMYVENTFLPMDSPYPGLDSYGKGCDNPYKPNITVVETSKYSLITYMLYADRQMVFVGCERESLPYLAEVDLLYCGDYQTLYHVESFIPRNVMHESLFKSLGCNKLRQNT